MSPTTLVSARKSPNAPRERGAVILNRLRRFAAPAPSIIRLINGRLSADSLRHVLVSTMRCDVTLRNALSRLARQANFDSISVTQASHENIAIEDLVDHLGLSVARNGVIVAGLLDSIQPPHGQHLGAESWTGIWKHSVAVASMAETLAEAMADVDAGQAFACGLLHDIGKLALYACMPKGYARILDQVERHGNEFCDVERDLFSLDHTIAGKEIGRAHV